MSDNTDFINGQSEAAETNIDVAKEDKMAAESEATGKISKDEVEGLKDTIGGGEVLDDSEGYTRSSNKDADPTKSERDVDAAVDALE